MSQPNPPEPTVRAEVEPAGLPARLAAMNPRQRAALRRRLAEKKGAVIAPAPPLRRGPSPGEAVYPASRGQQRMWFLQEYDRDSPAYNTLSAFHLAGRLDVGRLNSALAAVVRRHDVLRTTLVLENGELLQRVAATFEVQLREVDLETTPVHRRRAAAERAVNAEAGRAFDLCAAPAWRATLWRLQADEHILLLTWHHSISDGWSRAIFFRDLAAAYRDLRTGDFPPEQPPPVQYVDYSAWQTRRLTGNALDPQAEFWRAQLAGAPATLNLPADRPRPAGAFHRGGRATRKLEPGLIAALGARAQEEGATLFMILFAAFATLLHRYTEQEDLLVGVPIANRPRPELEALLGYFANTLVLRTHPKPNLTFRDFLRLVRDACVAAYAHQDLPFERLVELLNLPRDASRPPLFQVSFALQDFPAVEFNVPEIQATPWPATTQTSKFDLSWTLERAADGWLAAAEFSTDLFEAERIERMLDHWGMILRSGAESPDQRLADMALLTPTETQQILGEWNRTGRDYPVDQCVHHLFEACVRRTPEAVAVEFSGARLSYGDLNERADRLAARLRTLGVGPDELVGVCLERSFDMVVALLGILKAGGGYVPLDPKYPRERVDFILRDSGARVLVSQRALHLAPGPTHRIFMDDPASSSAPPTPTPGPEPTPTNLAYVIYTSGSTGQPKGVAIEHRNTVAFLHWVRETFSDAELSGVLASTSICFDLSVFEIFGALCSGGRVLLVHSAVDLASPGAPADASLLNTVPSALAELLRGRGLPASIRTVNLAGEPLRQPLVEEILRHTAATQVNDLYGPSETTTYSTWARRQHGGVETVGRPIANTRIYLLDAQGQPVPVGVTGEICIGGAGVARGYWRRPELTAERFVPDRFHPAGGGRLFKTGDRGRWRADGQLVLLGRRDGQVKLRGFRIELGEIEAALRLHPVVAEAAVVLREDAGGPRLVAYLVPQSAEKPDAATLRARLAERLPAYMLPGAFVWLDRLPLTPNGKLDRHALPAVEAPPGAHTGEDGPVSPLEQELMELWQALFQRRDLGRHDDFFELGGHSLLALRLAAAMEERLHRRVPIALLFQASTVATLAARLSETAAASRPRSLVRLQPHGSKPAVFCVHGLFGDVYRFLELARALAPARPVFGLQGVGLDGREPRHTSVEQMATHYAREMRSVQPEGPYHLIGASLGGWVAYAVAQELSRSGAKVASLALLDTRATAAVPWPVYLRAMAPFWAHRTQVHLRRLWHGPGTGRFRYFRQKATWFGVNLLRRRGRLPVRPASSSSPPADPNELTLDYFDAVAARYRPAKYAGEVTIFAGEDAQHFNHAALWQHFVPGRFRVIPVAGGHTSLIDEHHIAQFVPLYEHLLTATETKANHPPP